MDIAGLSKLSKQTILNLVMALGFLAHGYATGEFEVTDERLGVYLPTEHMCVSFFLSFSLSSSSYSFAPLPFSDNPKGYASDQPGQDARPYDSRLRPPVNPQELEIDPRTGMKVRHLSSLSTSSLTDFYSRAELYRQRARRLGDLLEACPRAHPSVHRTRKARS